MILRLILVNYNLSPYSLRVFIYIIGSLKLLNLGMWPRYNHATISNGVEKKINV